MASLDRADQDPGRALLKGMSESVLYEASLTVMMRLVFLLSAEERGLLLLGDPLYDQHYAASTLRAQLHELADQGGRGGFGAPLRRVEPAAGDLPGRAWRIQHENLRLPANGGSLFDPDRFPFLEGRAAGTRWRETPAYPLPINNRTVLHLLDALQMLKVKVPGGGPRRHAALASAPWTSSRSATCTKGCSITPPSAPPNRSWAWPARGTRSRRFPWPSLRLATKRRAKRTGSEPFPPTP